MIVVAVAIAAERRGPVLVWQNRVGRDRKPFAFVKFRTLPTDTPQRPTHEIDQDSARPLGRFLRRSKLDELPQLFLVLFGSMSMVGPRPCLTSQTELIGARQARGVFALRPGITGLAQVHGIDMSDPERLARADSIYRARRTVSLDLKIIAQTARIILRRG